ncbi:hypothetical protein D3C80_1476040 [compost metagenome]
MTSQVAVATATAPAASQPAISGFITASTTMTRMATPPLAPAVQSLDEAVGATGEGECSYGMKIDVISLFSDWP